ncbi:hypothetical protein BGZ47_003081 [Haplosporangium gracile]|nr:hypothetical protein BGZ47_003081 [Haplosporangium gracile]
MDYLADFKDYQRRTGDSLAMDSLAMDMIADVSMGRNEPRSFSKWLKDRHGADGLKEARFKHQASKAIEDMWPSMHHFAFGDVIGDKVNEREAFVDTTWSFVRTALTIAGIPTRMMKIQIDGNRDRKAEAKQKGGR